MTLPEFLAELKACPIIASVQADSGTPLANPSVIARLARASQSQGVRLLRIEGVEDIMAVQGARIGLIKARHPDSDVFITPTLREVDALLALGVEVVALDGTQRPRPGGVTLPDLVRRVHDASRLALADCDSPESARFAVEAGADLVSTTLCGYTGGPILVEPDLEVLRAILEAVGNYSPSAHPPSSSRRSPSLGNEGEASGRRVPVLAEGRFSEEWQVRAALQIGAAGVVIGGALNDPIKQTRRFVRAVSTPSRVAAFDIGGTWLRYGWFVNGALVESERIPLPPGRLERLAWMASKIPGEAKAVGVSTGGVVDPKTNVVTQAKPIIPDHVGTHFLFGDLPVSALSDGLASAWGHACLPQFAGRRVATLALGTGVGFGLVDRGRIWMGPSGEYPRLNDVLGSEGRSIEDDLGGAALSPSPSAAQRELARHAASRAVELVQKLFLPDAIVLCGGVGLAEWLDLGLVRSPFGADASLSGAAALATANG